MTFHAKLREHVPETCTQIDKVINRVQGALFALSGECDNFAVPDVPESVLIAIKELQDVPDIMEALRTANTRLRALACEYLGEIKRLEDIMDDYRIDAENMKERFQE